ncbi:MAG: lipoate--protein ligase family protein [Actinomycetota bacterium]
MRTNWELVNSGPTDALQNMAIDSAILQHSIAIRRQTPILRFYSWTQPCLSFGTNRSLSPDVLFRCNNSGVQVVQRPTGGGAVLHDEDLTYSVVAPSVGGVLETYRWVAQGLIEGFAKLGITADISQHSGPADAIACFAQPTGADLEVEGRKICGSAQVRRNGWFLQHGSIPMHDVRAQTCQLLGLSEVDSSTCLNELVPGAESQDLIEALTEGYASVWGAVAQLSSNGLD